MVIKALTDRAGREKKQIRTKRVHEMFLLLPRRAYNILRRQFSSLASRRWWIAIAEKKSLPSLSPLKNWRKPKPFPLVVQSKVRCSRSLVETCAGVGPSFSNAVASNLKQDLRKSDQVLRRFSFQYIGIICDLVMILLVCSCETLPNWANVWFFPPFFNLFLNHPGFPIGSSKDLGQEEGIEGAPPGTFLRDP